ncbi:MAG: carboxypeptidase regulatory-like domain-containing protein [Gemmatimonadaceae bacterium]|nr:carboxypeptidase regulatory-like domain-containing protein [Gemmatimonadaceae bacterium]
MIDRASSAPLSGADVIHTADSRTVRSDSTGRYLFDSLPAGVVRLIVRARGFPVQPVAVALTPGEALEYNIAVDSAAFRAQGRGAQSLPQVNVNTTATARGRRYVDFERRRTTGRGHYLTAEEIEKNGYNNLQDAVRAMRGVNVECGGGGGCFIRMARAPMMCNPEYIVDENVNNFFGPTIAIRDIEALEVYTGPSEVPGEFAGRNAGCGVIVIWTKSGPPRKKNDK